MFCLLEAAAAAGGRIASSYAAGSSAPVETGAEFIHGKLPLTLKLLNKANIDYVPVTGRMIRVQNGKWHKSVEHNKQWGIFMQQLGKLKTDIPLGRMLTLYFPGARFALLRQSVQRFAEGFDLADINKVSALAAQQEWAHDDEQYRLPGGYMQLINYLLHTCQQQGATLHCNTEVNSIEYNKENVTVYSHDGRQFLAARIILTVSAGILQSRCITFTPALDMRYANAIQQLGFGDVIKIHLQFSHPFWTKKSADIGFLLSDEDIPTWWTQLPAENNLLTGWLGGPAATARSGDTEEELLDAALKSLSGIFQIAVEELRKDLVNHAIHCWRNHPYTKGGYSFVTTESARAKKNIVAPG